MFSDREIVELFHLHFLRLLVSGRDKGKYVVKGGCNLRFFFGSIRYSQDIDLDVDPDIAQHELKERIEKIQASPVLRDCLAVSGVHVSRTSAPKQTPTTQRWKIELEVKGRPLPLHTKIEFSRRGISGDTGLAPIAPRVLSRYQLMPILAPHYLLPTAIRQKVHALAHRKEVQARDVFDLCLLFSQGIPATIDFGPELSQARDRVLELSYSDYKSQVVAYLVPEEAEPLASKDAWETMQLQILEALDRLAS